MMAVNRVFNAQSIDQNSFADSLEVAWSGLHALRTWRKLKAVYFSCSTNAVSFNPDGISTYCLPSSMKVVAAAP